MSFSQHSPKSLDELAVLIKKQRPMLFFSAQTSTVIPYDHLEEYCSEDLNLVDLGQLPSSMQLEGDNLRLKGPVSWQEARLFLEGQGRTLKMAPTEELASVLAGVATSCTGERSFGYGAFRQQILELKFLDHQAQERVLSSKKPFSGLISQDKKNLLFEYNQTAEAYAGFKNAPFPLFENETDLMVGTEGQLGVVTEVLFETISLKNLVYFFVRAPRWENDFSLHQKMAKAVQSFRGKVYAVELIDSNSMSFLAKEDRLTPGHDAILFEMEEEYFEEVFENLMACGMGLEEDQVFQISRQKINAVRAAIPRRVNEELSRKNLQKKGTDIQVDLDQFEKLIERYRLGAKLGVRYLLFGHFGDGHLHFNFLPEEEKIDEVQSYLEETYQYILSLKSSPFAEHGIGLLKQKFIRKFQSQIHWNLFQALKEEWDPKKIFFPQGFMTMDSNK